MVLVKEGKTEHSIVGLDEVGGTEPLHCLAKRQVRGVKALFRKT